MYVYICMYVCMLVRMYVCMYVCIKGERSAAAVTRLSEKELYILLNNVQSETTTMGLGTCSQAVSPRDSVV